MRQSLLDNLHTFKNENYHLKKIKTEHKGNNEQKEYQTEIKQELGIMADNIEEIHVLMDNHKNE